MKNLSVTDTNIVHGPKYSGSHGPPDLANAALEP